MLCATLSSLGISTVWPATTTRTAGMNLVPACEMLGRLGGTWNLLTPSTHTTTAPPGFPPALPLMSPASVFEAQRNRTTPRTNAGFFIVALLPKLDFCLQISGG